MAPRSLPPPRPRRPTGPPPCFPGAAPPSPRSLPRAEEFEVPADNREARVTLFHSTDGCALKVEELAGVKKKGLEMLLLRQLEMIGEPMSQTAQAS
ncbi:hypothetical protein ZWY2020_021562 [Hordeum vulgare]|nr:hypothetical protein ZWY2020_021562 [Hordeum vulgare]